MGLPHIFANLPAGNTPAAYLDDNFSALGAIVVIPCTATGTNTIALAPFANTPALAAYNQLQGYRFIAAATSSGAVTIQVSALGALPAYFPGVSGPVAVGSGNIVVGECYDAIYDVALDSGSGGFHLYNVIQSSSSSSGTVRVYGSYTANADLSTAIPADDTVPLNTEGTQIISISVVTTSPTQRTRLTFTGIAGVSTQAYVIAAIFNGSTCIDAVASFCGNTINPQPVVLNTTIELVIGSATTTTFTVRVGGSSGTVRMNGTASARLFGGTATTTLVADTWEP